MHVCYLNPSTVLSTTKYSRIDFTSRVSVCTDIRNLHWGLIIICTLSDVMNEKTKLFLVGMTFKCAQIAELQIQGVKCTQDVIISLWLLLFCVNARTAYYIPYKVIFKSCILTIGWYDALRKCDDIFALHNICVCRM